VRNTKIHYESLGNAVEESNTVLRTSAMHRAWANFLAERTMAFGSLKIRSQTTSRVVV